MIAFLADIQIPGGAPGSTPMPDFRDIAPPMEAPMPLWLKILIWVAALVAAGLIGWGIVALVRRKPKIPPLTPRQIALKALEELYPKIHTMDPYAFSIEVSDVLRSYVGTQFGLRARLQTSPEFLADVRRSPAFTNDDQQLLADFVEKCDLVKFARIGADESTSQALIDSAAAFVRGVKHELGSV